MDDELIRRLRISHYAKMAYVVITCGADNERISELSRDRIAKEGDMPVRTVAKAVADLECYHMIRVERGAGVKNV